MLRNCLRLFKPLRNVPVHSITNSNFRLVHCTACLEAPRQTPKSTDPKANSPSPAIAGKYQIIEESNATIIQNTDEEIYEESYPLVSDEFDGVNLKRGVNGVFDIEDLVDLLKRENAKDIFVATVPRDINYVDYICVVSGRSKRHILAIAEFVRKVFKRKKNRNDMIPKIEGKKSDEWMALDLGNIALHVFSDKARQTYDLETLWAVGAEYDDQTHKKDDKILDLLENYTTYLKDLKPLA